MRDNYIYFAGKMLSDFDTFITNAGVYDTPARNYDSVEVAGRNGNLLFENNRFDNIEHKYPTIIMSDFDKNFAGLRSFLLSQKGYQRLSDTFNPDEFYLATFKGFDGIKQEKLNTNKNTKGICTLIFERKPQRYLKSGETKYTFTGASSLLNPTMFEALPLIRVYGDGTLTINSVSIAVNTDYAHLDIDCELQEVLQVSGNLDVTLTNGKFPKLDPGINNISFTGFSEIEITPRWWTL